MSEISLALALDLVIVAICAGFLWASGRLSAFHPAVLYIFCHLYAVTARLLTLLGGVIPLAPLHEVLRAAFLCDIALIAVTGVFLHLARTADRQVRMHSPAKARTLQSRYVVMVAAVAFMIGLVGLWYFRFSGVDVISQGTLGGWSSSSWLWITIYWPIQEIGRAHV